LHVYGEQEYPVPPLGLPDSVHTEDLLTLSQFEAVDLFCQRARAVQPDFSLTEENIQSISEICIRLDGLPLAIELAAARSKLLSPQSMLARLQSRLLTLTSGARDLPARMQTLKAAIDWSYNLLEVDEQRLFDRLSVFQGGRTIEAIETVCESDLSFAILDGLESLLNKNLLYSKDGISGEARFYMLETIHEYARERLVRSGEADNFRTRHAMYFVALAERAEAEFHEIKQEYWYARLTDELDNVRVALSWTLDGANLEFGARLVSAMREFWYWKGLLSEGSAWIDRTLKAEGHMSPTVRAKTINSSSLMTYARGDFAAGARLARQALSLARDINEIETCAWASLFLSISLMESDGQVKEVQTHAEEGLRLFRDLDHKAGIVLGLNTQGELARLDGDYVRAGQLYKECLAMATEIGNKQRTAVALANLSYVAYHEANYCEAVEYGREALALLDSLQMEHAIAVVLAIIAGPIAAKGKPELAARLLAASETQMEAIGASFKPVDKFEVVRFKKAIMEQLGEMEFNKAWTEGRAMTLEQVLAEVIGEN
jgi:predicted ATPase